MRLRILLVLSCLALTLPARADPASHRKTAADLVDLINGPESMKAGFNAMLNPMLADLKSKGAPDEAIADIKAALEDWLAKEIVWDELREPMIDLYVREFTESELRDLAGFYKSPTGAKALKRMPVLLNEGVAIGQKYAASKQASLMERLRVVGEKHQLK